MSENKQYAIMPLEDYQNACNKIKEKTNEILVNETFSESTIEIPDIAFNLEKEYEVYVKVLQRNFDKTETTEYNLKGKPTSIDVDTYGYQIKGSLPMATSGGGDFILRIYNTVEGIIIYWTNFQLSEEFSGFSEYIVKIQEVGDKILSADLSNKVEKTYNKGIKIGAENYKKSWWDIYQNYGNRTNYANAFFNFGWTKDTYNPQYPIYSASSSNMFAWSYITDTKVLIKIYDTSAASSVFSNCSKLITILSLDLTDYKQTFTNWFANCSQLANIKIIGSIYNTIDFRACPLTKESIISIFTALSTILTNNPILYLSKTAVDKAFEETSGNGIMPGTQTQVWTDLVASKPNWKIELV